MRLKPFHVTKHSPGASHSITCAPPAHTAQVRPPPPRGDPTGVTRDPHPHPRPSRAPPPVSLGAPISGVAGHHYRRSQAAGGGGTPRCHRVRPGRGERRQLRRRLDASGVYRGRGVCVDSVGGFQLTHAVSSLLKKKRTCISAALE